MGGERSAIAHLQPQYRIRDHVGRDGTPSSAGRASGEFASTTRRKSLPGSALRLEPFPLPPTGSRCALARPSIATASGTTGSAWRRELVKRVLCSISQDLPDPEEAKVVRLGTAGWRRLTVVRNRIPDPLRLFCRKDEKLHPVHLRQHTVFAVQSYQYPEIPEPRFWPTGKPVIAAFGNRLHLDLESFPRRCLRNDIGLLCTRAVRPDPIT